MSTPAFIHRKGSDQGVRIHYDGYPTGVGVELARILMRDGFDFAMAALEVDGDWRHLSAETENFRPGDVDGYGNLFCDGVPCLFGSDCEYDFVYEVSPDGDISIATSWDDGLSGSVNYKSGTVFTDLVMLERSDDEDAPTQLTDHEQSICWMDNCSEGPRCRDTIESVVALGKGRLSRPDAIDRLVTAAIPLGQLDCHELDAFRTGVPAEDIFA